MVANWNPRPRADLSNFGRRSYYAGYSDGFCGYSVGSGDDGTLGAFSDYRPGFEDGRKDATSASSEIGPAAEARR